LNSTTSFRWLLAANKNVFGIVCHDANRLEGKKRRFFCKEEKIESSCRLSLFFFFVVVPLLLVRIRMDRPFWIDGVAIFFLSLPLTHGRGEIVNGGRRSLIDRFLCVSVISLWPVPHLSPSQTVLTFSFNHHILLATLNISSSRQNVGEKEKKISHSSHVIINIKLKRGHFSSSSNTKFSQRSIIRVVENFSIIRKTAMAAVSHKPLSLYIKCEYCL
jgi:hypothetical protein